MIPSLVSGLRLALAPVLLALAWSGRSGLFLACLIASLVTDAADGLLARRLNQATSLGAKLDSWGDFVTALALPFCGWWLRPDAVRQEALYLAAGICVYLGAVVVGFCKFRRLTSYHTWGAKLSSILFGAAVLGFFAGGPSWGLRLAMPIVVLASLEEIVITVTLPELQANVPSLWHALRIRQQARNGSRNPL